jgi:hypothetical protein
MENKMMVVLMNLGLSAIGSEISYIPYTKNRKLVSISKQHYSFPKRNILGFKYCTVYYFKRSKYSPERIMLTGGDKSCLKKIADYLKINLNTCRLKDEESILCKLFEDYFFYEDEENYVSGGINKKNNLTEIVISKKGIHGFNTMMKDHVNYMATQLNEIYAHYNFSNISFYKTKPHNSIKTELSLLFCKRLHIETIAEIITNQKLISQKILNAMEFIFSDCSLHNYLLDENKEQFLYDGKIKFNWVQLIRKYKRPDIIFYYGTGLFKKSNQLELSFTLYTKIAHE